MAFQLIAGHPALDLVNTLDWRFAAREPEELLGSYADLLRFAEQSRILTADQTRQLSRSADAKTAARALNRCRDLREALAEIFYADGQSFSASSVGKLERFFQAARRGQKLGGKRERLRWEWPSQSGAELPLWALSLSAADLMLSDAMRRVRTCGNPECRWLFLDTSKNHTRRWCDMKLCGNRMKARRFKAQRKAGTAHHH